MRELPPQIFHLRDPKGAITRAFGNRKNIPKNVRGHGTSGSENEMSRTAPQFDPSEQIGAAIGELEVTLAEAAATIERLFRLKGRLATEIEQIRAERERLDIYDEDEAAAMLKLKPKHLAELRRRHDLPHVNFGNVIRYTKPQIAAICEVMAIHQKRTPAAIRRAA